MFIFLNKFRSPPLIWSGGRLFIVEANITWILQGEGKFFSDFYDPLGHFSYTDFKLQLSFSRIQQANNKSPRLYIRLVYSSLSWEVTYILVCAKEDWLKTPPQPLKKCHCSSSLRCPSFHFLYMCSPAHRLEVTHSLCLHVSAGFYLKKKKKSIDDSWFLTDELFFFFFMISKEQWFCPDGGLTILEEISSEV